MKTVNVNFTRPTEYLRYLWSRPVRVRSAFPNSVFASPVPVPATIGKLGGQPRNILGSARQTSFALTVPSASLRGILGIALIALSLLILGNRAFAQANPCPETNVFKFMQAPNQDGGFDVWDSGPWALADDFQCTNTGPIVDIHLWGSFLNDAVDFNTTFWLGIYDDVPAVTNGPAIIPSRPGTNLIWQQYFGPGQYAQTGPSLAPGQFIDPGPPASMGGDSQMFYFCFYPTNPPVQTGTVAQPKIYWLAAYAMPSQGTSFNFGWKSAKFQQFDVSTHTPWPGSAPITANWVPTRSPNNLALDLAFKVNTATNPPQLCCPETNGAKFVQHPMVPGGLDVNATRSPAGQPLVLADDFRCTNTGPVTDIHLWGSWLSDNVDPNAVFTLTIWSDVPKQTNGGTVLPSHPGTVLWSQPFGPGEYYECLYTNITEQFFDPSVPAVIGGDSKVYYLCFYPRNPFVQQGTAAVPTNYWLSVNAQTTAGSQLNFGWHTSYEYYNDDAVWGAAPFPAAWNSMKDPQTGGPLSLAFKITTPTNPPCPPGTIICPPSKTVQCNTPWNFDDPRTTNACCGTNNTLIVIGTTTNGVCPQTITRTWQVTDCSGFTANCSQAVSVTDTNPPTFTYCPTNRTVQCGTPWTFDVPIATDDCCLQGVSLLGTATNGTCPQVITAYWVARDCCGNTNICAPTITVVDTTPPVFTLCPTNRTVECGTSWAFDVPIVTDNCCLQGISILDTITNGLCPQLITRLWLARDCCGNTNTCSQTITVVDTTPPSLTCSPGKTVQCGSSWTFDPPIATDRCCSNPVVNVFSTVTNGICPQIIIRTWVAYDCCGNSNMCSQVVTNIDTTPPVLSCSPDKTVECGSAWTFDTPFASDNCCSNPVVNIVTTVTNGAPCNFIAYRIWRATDCCGNLSLTCTQRVSIVDTTPPNIVCPTNRTVGTCFTNAVVTWPLFATDTCSTNITVYSTPASGSAFSRGTTNKVVVTATDGCGNTNTCTFTVTVVSPILTIDQNHLLHTVTVYYNDGILQHATNLLGPYSDVLFASPPSYTTSASDPHRFYRVRCP